jgi:prepilin-type processing-associated H-X9-DG protein
MAIPFTCPHCGAFSQVASEYAGMTGPCAQCGKSITVPGAAVFDSSGSAALAPPAVGRSPVLWIVLLAVAVLMLLACGGVLVALLLPAVNAAREAGRRAVCQNNLKQISVALENYHVDYGTYPPAYIADADGTPIHSWRALLLRYIDEDLAAQYDFNEPWDSEKNQQLWGKMPSTFACPSDPDTMQRHTSYVAIVGPGYFFSGDQPTDQSQIVDPSSTIAVVESAGHLLINWLEPRDITADELSDTVGDRNAPSISSNHVRGANVLMADGSTEYLPSTTAEIIIESFLPIAKPEMPAESIEHAEKPLP